MSFLSNALKYPNGTKDTNRDAALSAILNGQKKKAETNPFAGAITGAQTAVDTPATSYYPSVSSSGGTAVVDSNYSAYRQNMLDLLKQSYQNSLANNQTQYDNSLKSAQGTYDAGKNDVDAAANKSLQEAYVNRMISQRDMAQNLAAQGLSGGASETARASLLNNYGNSRNNIETSRQSNISNLANTLLQAAYSAANSLSERNASDAQKYYTQAAEYSDAPTLTTSSGNTASSYKTNQDWIADYVGVQNGKYNKSYLQQNAAALVSAYGYDGYKALLSSAQY